MRFYPYLYCVCRIFVVLLSRNRNYMITERNLIQERKETDFLKEFDNVVKQLRSADIEYKTNKVCSLVAQRPAPCFYVSIEQALYQYRLYKQGISNIRNSVRRRMYAEIFARFENILETTPTHKFQYEIMEMVLKQPAPCFYLDDYSALQFYYNAIKKRRKQRKQQ